MLAALLLFLLAAPPEPRVGDPVRVDAGVIVLDGTLAAHDASGWRVRLSNGEVFVPAELARSVTVRAEGVTLPPVPPKPVLVPATPRTRPPSLPGGGGVWITRYPALLSLAAGAAPVTRETAMKAKTNALATATAVSAEVGVRFIAIGASAGFERAEASLVSAGGDACRRDEVAPCYEVPAGMRHETQAFNSGVWVKPNLLLGAFRVWGQAGIELSQLEYAYHDGKTRYAGGRVSESAPVYGAGFDWATPTRAWVVSASVFTGTPEYRENVDDLLGAPWKSGQAPVRPPVRFTLGVSMPLGGRR